MRKFNLVNTDGSKKKMADEILFLIKYLVDLKDEGFERSDMFEILGQTTGSLLEAWHIDEKHRWSYYGFIEDIVKAARHEREKSKENKEG